MAEYVCEIVPDRDGVGLDSDDFSGECKFRERVVRCRDCKFYYGGECTLLDFSLRDMEDGYCAWSEPREEG